jgi:hypothetical protein
VTLLQTAPDVTPHHTEPGHRPARLSVAEALRSRFSLRGEPGQGQRMPSVAEALRSRFPLVPRPPAQASTAGADAPRPGTTPLVRRIRKSPVAVAPAEWPASPELMLRVLDGLRRL